MANKTYQEKLKDPRWQKKRLEILQRDKWKCQMCQSESRTLNVHHTVYAENPWEVDNKCLITLCEQCHAEETRDYSIAIDTLKQTVREQGFTAYSVYELINFINTYMDNTKIMVDATDFAFFLVALNTLISKKFVSEIHNREWEIIDPLPKRKSKGGKK